MAARYADEYNTPFPTLAAIAEGRERIERACEAAGREMLPFSIMTGVLVATSEDELRERARRLGEKMGADPAGLVNDPPAGWIVGTVPAAVEQLHALREAGVARVVCQQLLHDDLEHVALLGEELAPQLA
jgi:alkanesulfonate monooxygenase SsuD/methylene tetrahydromethanopterin reductase-like flavin-dependent oxidoreductase (luciferase family)